MRKFNKLQNNNRSLQSLKQQLVLKDSGKENMQMNRRSATWCILNVSIDVHLFNNIIYPMCTQCSSAVTYYHVNQLNFGHLKRNLVHDG